MCAETEQLESLCCCSYLMRSVCYDGDLNASCVLTALCDGTCPSDRQSCSPAPAPGRCLCSLLSPGVRTLTGLWAPIPRSRPPELSALAPGPAALRYSGLAIIWAGDWMMIRVQLHYQNHWGLHAARNGDTLLSVMQLGFTLAWIS